MEKATVSKLRKRRGVTRASMTRIKTCIREMVDPTNPETKRRAQSYDEKLKNLDAEFKIQHFEIIDALDDEDDLAAEQEVLDDHDETLSSLRNDLKRIIEVNITITDGDKPRLLTRKLNHLSKVIAATHSEIEALLAHGLDTYLLQQHQVKLLEIKSELKSIHDSLLELGVEETDVSFATHTTLSDMLFKCLHLVRKALGDNTCSSTIPDMPRGIKLPKLEVPTFDGNPINWNTFWEQFCVPVHEHPNISKPEKLVYLQQALKNGTAKQSIEGLSRTGDNYSEAVECLKERYDRPRLIHRTHVQMIVEIPSLKNGTGKELREFHDKIKQHLRALRAMGKEPDDAFITSVLELKLDPETMFEWQKHSQESRDIPSYEDLLEFLNLRAKASEVHNPRRPRNPPLGRSITGKPIGSFHSHTSNSYGNCILCKNDKHPLYVCPKFKAYSHDKMVSVLKENGICMNCLRVGHFVKQCKSSHHCRKCQKPHHTLLHVDKPELDKRPPESEPHIVNKPLTPVSSSAASALSSDILLMTCRVNVEAPDNSSIAARALLDSGSSVSFISERLAQTLCLPRSTEGVNISGVAGLQHQ